MPRLWRKLRMTQPWWLVTLILALAAPVQATQIVMLDLESTSKLSTETKTELEAILRSTLASRKDTNIISADDVRALIARASQIASLSQLTEASVEQVATVMGSEFVLSSQVGTLGEEWVVSLSLHDAKAGQVFRRSTEVRVGSEDATKEAMMSAAYNLFREGIPDELLGPRSMSALGFHAITLGLSRSMEKSLEHAQTYRQTIILDLIATELDYDVRPKLEILERTSRSELAKLKTQALMAENEGDFDLKLDAQQVWHAMRDDLERVREIRARARDLGIVPSARPLRFEAPTPVVWPTSNQAAAYRETVTPLIDKIEAMLAALSTREEETFLSFWSPDHHEAAFRRLQTFGPGPTLTMGMGERAFKVVPLQNLSPQMLQLAITAFMRGELLVYLCGLHDGTPTGHDSVFLIRSDERWLIRHW